MIGPRLQIAFTHFRNRALPYMRNFPAGSSTAWKRRIKTRMKGWICQRSRGSCVWSTLRWTILMLKCSSRWSRHRRLLKMLLCCFYFFYFTSVVMSQIIFSSTWTGGKQNVPKFLVFLLHKHFWLESRRVFV